MASTVIFWPVSVVPLYASFATLTDIFVYVVPVNGKDRVRGSKFNITPSLRFASVKLSVTRALSSVVFIAIRVVISSPALTFKSVGQSKTISCFLCGACSDKT
jgi:hypothetical protein